jgi:hypothetical protein
MPPARPAEKANTFMNLRSGLRTLAASLSIVAGISAIAQTDMPPAPPAAAPAPAAGPTDPVAKPWRVGPMDVSGFVDGYYSYNHNNPTEADNGKMNDFYNFNQDANQPGLSAAKVTLNHDPGLLGARIDLIYGRTNRLVNAPGQLEYVEQAYISTKPPKAKGLEVDLGKWVTSAGAEVIEAKDNWNYSRSLLFAWAIPYYHFGLRSSMPVSKTDTVGLQVVNGWNNITQSVGGVTLGFTNALVEPKYTWSANVYTGPEDLPGQKGYRNLFDTTLLLTPNAKFNAYANFDFGEHKNNIDSQGQGNSERNKWDGVAFAAHEQFTGKTALAGRIEVFDDQQGYSTGTAQTLKEFTGTYEYKMKYGLLSRLEYRHDWSDQPAFHKENGMTDSQSTVSAGLILVITPKR